MMTPESLFQYVIKYTADAVAADSNRLYPTYREISYKFRVNYDQIEDACQSWDHSKGYMQTAVGFSCAGGTASFDRRGDYLIEAYL
jgi:hypothetical protein